MKCRMLLVLSLIAPLAGSCGSPAKSSLQMSLVPPAAYRLTIRTDGTWVLPQQDAIKYSRDMVLVLRAAEIYDNGDVGAIILFDKPNMLRIDRFVEGREFTGRVSPRGRVTEVNGLSALREEIRAEIPVGTPGTFGSGEQVIHQIGDDEVLATLNPVLNIWPPTPVSEGDEWTREPIYEPTSRTYIHTHFRLTSMHASDAKIEFTTTYRRGPEPSSESVGSGEGEVHVTPSAGTLTSYRGKSTVEIQPAEPGGTSGGRTESTTYVTFARL